MDRPSSAATLQPAPLIDSADAWGLRGMVSEREWRAIEGLASTQDVGPNGIVLPPDSDHLVLICTGVVLDCDPVGRALVGDERWSAAEVLTSGDMLGEPDISGAGQQAGASRRRLALASTKVALMRLSRTDVTTLMRKEPGLSRRIAQYFWNRCQRHAATTVRLSREPRAQSLARTLVELAEMSRRVDSSPAGQIPVSLRHVASLAGVPAKGLPSVLARWQQRQIVELRSDDLVSVVDEGLLRRVADGAA